MKFRKALKRICAAGIFAAAFSVIPPVSAYAAAGDASQAVDTATAEQTCKWQSSAHNHTEGTETEGTRQVFLVVGYPQKDTGAEARAVLAKQEYGESVNVKDCAAKKICQDGTTGVNAADRAEEAAPAPMNFSVPVEEVEACKDSSGNVDQNCVNGKKQGVLTLPMPKGRGFLLPATT